MLLLLPSPLSRTPKELLDVVRSSDFSHLCSLWPSQTYPHFPSVKLFSSSASKNISDEFIWWNKSGKFFLPVLEKAAFQTLWDGCTKGKVFWCMWYFFFNSLRKYMGKNAEFQLMRTRNWNGSRICGPWGKLGELLHVRDTFLVLHWNFSRPKNVTCAPCREGPTCAETLRRRINAGGGMCVESKCI